MAEALVAGLVRARAVPVRRLHLWDPDPARLRTLSKRYGIRAASSNAEAVLGRRLVILCVKPQLVRDVAREIAPVLKPDQRVVSIAAGISVALLEKWFPGRSVIRAMPNQPAQVGAGMTVLCAGRRTTRDDLRTVETIFQAVGAVSFLPESKFDAVTALSGSGPAFFYEILNALIEGGIRLGLPPDTARTLGIETMTGAVQTVRATGKPLPELIAEVVSPRGTTEAGLKSLERAELKKILFHALKSAAERSQTIRREWEKTSARKEK